MLTVAIDRMTNNEISVYLAEKGKVYLCPNCKGEVIKKQGQIKSAHFCHKEKSSCDYGEGETDIHKNAKKILRILLENQADIVIIDSCHQRKSKFLCPNGKRTRLVYGKDRSRFGNESKTEISEISVIEEFRLEDGGICDVAMLVNGKLKYIFEIYHTHRSKPREGTWFEISATEILDEFRRKVSIKDREISNEEKSDVRVSFGEINLHNLRRDFYCESCELIRESDWIDLLPTVKYRNKEYFGQEQDYSCFLCDKSIYSPIWKPNVSKEDIKSNKKTKGEWKPLCYRCVIKYGYRISDIYLKHNGRLKLGDLRQMMTNVRGEIDSEEFYERNIKTSIRDFFLQNLIDSDRSIKDLLAK